jgi:ABC-type polysaccharide/polyol phosphate export permease
LKCAAGVVKSVDPMLKRLLEVYKYRELLRNLVITELKLRYRRSVLGMLWTMLNPLGMMLILTAVFSVIMRFDTKDYAILLLSGLLPWIYFSQCISGSLMSIIGKGELLKKVYIPKIIIPLSVVVAGLINFMVSFVPLLAIMFFLGHPIRPALIFLPVAIAILAVFAAGLSFIFSCLNVFFRDFTHMTEVLLQAWFYLSPILYKVDMIPERYRGLFQWNPMFQIIDCFRAPIFDGQFPSLINASIAVAWSLVALLLGTAIFVRYDRYLVLRV